MAARGPGDRVLAWFGERALERIAPVLSGLAGTDGDLPVDVVPPPAASAQAFAVSRPDHLAVARLATALRDVRDVGIERIEAELSERARDVIFFADRYEVPVVTPREPERRAGIVTLAPAPQDAGPLAASLANHGITVTVRAGLVRVAPHVGTGAEHAAPLRRRAGRVLVGPRVVSSRRLPRNSPTRNIAQRVGNATVVRQS